MIKLPVQYGYFFNGKHMHFVNTRIYDASFSLCYM